MIQATSVPVRVADVSGQTAVDVLDVPTDASVGEFVEGVLPRLNLPRNDSAGRRLAYHARLDREGRHLHSSERVGDVLMPNDRLVLAPEIHAGAGR
jgi:hypothetical protein